jgi:quinol monooxygenase YgiN
VGVLAMLELDGDTDRLLAALAEVERLLPRPDGLQARIVAVTGTGVVLFQLWESAEARERHNLDPHHHAVLEEAGVLTAARARRSRAFERAEMH